MAALVLTPNPEANDRHFAPVREGRKRAAPDGVAVQLPPAAQAREPAAQSSPNIPARSSAVPREEADRNVRAPAGGQPTPLPHISPVLLRLFRWYARRFIARHFHAVRLAGEVYVPADLPLVVYCNHASWWDPMMLLLLGDWIAPGRSHYAPVDADAIERYKMFKRMGFFGVEQRHRRGAVEFLRTSQAILSQPHSALWLTPQGRFADPRERPTRFQRGLGVLATRSLRTVFLPVAMEYTFWEERLPEAVIRVGQPTWVEEGSEFSDEKWTRLFEANLLEAQERLADAVIRRDSSVFKTVLQGFGGVNRVYDGWRALMAGLRGETFRRQHGRL